jgi:hypothetical protein
MTEATRGPGARQPGASAVSLATVLFTQVADGVLRMGTPIFNWYLVAGDDGVTVLDAGAPRNAHSSSLASHSSAARSTTSARSSSLMATATTADSPDGCRPSVACPYTSTSPTPR